jgi:hypothetical protein
MRPLTERCSACDRAATFRVVVGRASECGCQPMRLMLCELHIGDARQRLRIVRVEALKARP